MAFQLARRTQTVMLVETSDTAEDETGIR